MNFKCTKYKESLLYLGLLLFFLFSCHACSGEFSDSTLTPSVNHSDAPDNEAANRIDADQSNISYARAIESWDSVADVNKWIAENFRYDLQRAKQLADSDRRRKIYIYEPAELFRTKKGVCVDLARFAYESLETIDPDLNPSYLMIEFEPLKIGDHTFRRYWLVAYRVADQLFVLADTKRPGYLSGPHQHLADYITE